ncbi:MAG: septal ring lytic transglycosylase RlpA family protein, partial [Flavobacteriales bacterium]
ITVFCTASLFLVAQSDPCTASYYHNKFEGRRTASGETFRQDSLMCAHKSLPFGTYIRVTNLKNDSSVVVKVTDRLPQSSKRCVDLTTRAAKQLNFIVSGLTKVSIEVLGTSKEEEKENQEKKSNTEVPAIKE